MVAAVLVWVLVPTTLLLWRWRTALMAACAGVLGGAPS